MIVHQAEIGRQFDTPDTTIYGYGEKGYQERCLGAGALFEFHDDLARVDGIKCSRVSEGTNVEFTRLHFRQGHLKATVSQSDRNSLHIRRGFAARDQSKTLLAEQVQTSQSPYANFCFDGYFFAG